MNILEIFEFDTSKIYQILILLALILGLSKIFGLGTKKIGLPQVVAMLGTGIILGLFALIPWVKDNVITTTGLDGIQIFAEIGVVLILFSAGLGTNVKQIKATGTAAIITTLLNVTASMALGIFVIAAFDKFNFSGEKEFITGTVVKNYWSYIFYGVILTATSVSVTVSTLKELGKLNSKIGTVILSSAILDDVIGVIILSIVLAVGSPSSGHDAGIAGIMEGWGLNSILSIIISTVLYFVFMILIGILIRKLFKFLDKKYPHHRRVPIYGLVVCFLLAYISQAVFNIADITGAYFAGLILSGRKSTEYVERRTDIISYIIFTPVFFAKIGLTTDWTKLSDAGSSGQGLGIFILIGVCYVSAGILGKLLGTALGAKITGYSTKDSFRAGIGMCARAEVCLVSAQKGIDAGMIDQKVQLYLIFLIIITSFAVPLLLKLSYKKELGVDENKVLDGTPDIINTPGTNFRESTIDNILDYEYEDEHNPIVSETSSGGDDDASYLSNDIY
ncbi:MAG: cation:proton antiporter [Acholeplasmatales bacterium]|nr:cation:proton antiporter [Acholeplasmatales bacterium]